jgi:hypothetical protein
MGTLNRYALKLQNPELTAFAINAFIVPDNAAAIPNRPLFRICIATLNPSPISNVHKMKGDDKGIVMMDD